MPENETPSVAQVDRLIESIGNLERELGATRGVVEKAAKRSRAAIRLSIVSIALIVMAFGVVLSNRAAVRASNEVRDDARIVACRYENKTIANLHVKLPAALSALVPTGTKLTDDQQARLNAYSESVRLGFPFRDCSPEGIRAYYQNLPPDPAVDG